MLPVTAAGSPASGLRRSCALIAAAWFLSGCAASTRTPGSAGARETVNAVPDTAGTTLELRMRRSAELSDSRGALRVFDQDVRVEYRAGANGLGLDAGEVTLEGRPLQRDVTHKGSVSYRLGRDEPEGGARAGGSAWLTLANSGGTRVSAASVRVKVAPFPLVTQPTPGQGVPRAEELAVVMLPPVADVWYRVTLVGAGDPVSAVDLGEGRWLFPRGSLENCTPGRARLLIEVEASCSNCTPDSRLRATWSSRSELELAVTLL